MDALHPLDVALLAGLARAALVLALAGLLLGLLGRHLSASARHAAWLMAVVAAFVVTRTDGRDARWRLELPRVPAWSASAEPEPQEAIPSPARDVEPPEATTAAAPAGTQELAAPVEASPSWSAPVAPAASTSSAPVQPPRPRPWLLWTWLAGVALALVRPLAGALRARRWVAEARPAPEGLRTEWLELAAGVTWRARLLESEHAPVPMTWGAFGATVLVPAGFADWPAEARRAALRHELAHVRRGDWLVQTFARLVAALHWCDPLGWLALRRLRREAEHACDDAALAGDASGAAYADQLLWVARGLVGTRTPDGAVAMARPSMLERRVGALLDPRVRRAEPGAAARVVGWTGAMLLAGALSQTELACAGPDDASAPTAVVTVAPDGSADHTSIQAAIDAAPEGALVRIAPGTYAERLVVDKGLTLEGEDWQRTLVTFPMTPPEGAVASRMNEEMRAASSNEEKLAIRERYEQEHGPWPTLRVQTQAPVRLRGLQFQLTGERREGQIAQVMAVWIRGGDVLVEACAVTDSPGTGIGVIGGTSVEIRDSLVAGVGATGIAVMGDQLGAPPSVHITDCEVRNCVHRGITVAAGNRTTRIEGCRISGSQWHGIRYDDAAPEIEGNWIFENARFGIYASGETEGVVRDNLFQSNGMAGASFWFGGRDLVEHNTFVGDQRSALEVIGAASPSIRRNVFFRTPRGVALSNSSGKGERSVSRNEVTLEGNLFHQVGEMLVPASLEPEDPQHQRLMSEAAENGNLELDPGFVDAASGDYRLAEGSPARAREAGATFSSVLFADPSPAPKSAAEVRVETAARQKAEAQQRQESQRSLHEQASVWIDPWVEDLMQIRDAELRRTTFESVCASLDSPDPAARYAALVTIGRTGEVALDREPLRPRLEEMARHEAGQLQVQALRTLLALERRPDDCALVRALLTSDPSPELRAASISLLYWGCNKDYTGETGALVLQLLNEATPDELFQNWTYLWGATSSPELQAWMLAHSRPPFDHEHRGRAVYFALSTSENKSPAIVERLVEALEGDDHEDRWRSLWGLTFGVSPEAHELAADAGLAYFQARTRPDQRDSAIRIVASYGSEKHLPTLRELADNELLPEGERELVRQAIRAVEARAGD